MHSHAAGEPACHRAGSETERAVPEGPAKYRPRDPAASPLFRLIDTYYEKVKGLWEECFEHRYGFWRGFVDAAIERFIACGDFECGYVITDYVSLSTFGARAGSGDPATPPT